MKSKKPKPGLEQLTTLPLIKYNPTQHNTTQHGTAQQQNPSDILGYTSGRRSGCVVLYDKVYRLKGCGDLTNGFPRKKVGDNEEMQIRGCLFDHTAQRAVYMHRMLCDVLRGSSIDCANTPVVIYQYDTTQHNTISSQSKTPNNNNNVKSQEAKPSGHTTQHDIRSTEEDASRRIKDSIDTTQHNHEKVYCVVSETLGDKRLGDHLLFGLEKLMPLVFRDFNTVDSLKEQVLQVILCFCGVVLCCFVFCFGFVLFGFAVYVPLLLFLFFYSLPILFFLMNINPTNTT